MRAAFWVDAGPEVGGGHAARAEALASSLARLGIESTLFAEDPEAVERAGSGKVHAEGLGDRTFDEVCAATGPDLAIVDLPHTRPADPDVLQRLSASGTGRVCFDSSDPTGCGSDLVVNAVAHPSDALPLPAGTRALFGPRYAVMRRSVGDARQLRRLRPAGPPRILVGFGASDPAGLTPVAVRALAAVSAPIRVDVLLGPLMRSDVAAETEREASALESIRLHRGVRDPAERLANADLGILAFGNLFFEAAASGLPALLWHPSPAHAAVSRRFQDHFAEPIAVDLGCADRDAAACVTRAVEELLQNPSQHRALAEAGMRALDGRGADRVARAASCLARSKTGG